MPLFLPSAPNFFEPKLRGKSAFGMNVNQIQIERERMGIGLNRRQNSVLQEEFIEDSDKIGENFDIVADAKRKRKESLENQP